MNSTAPDGVKNNPFDTYSNANTGILLPLLPHTRTHARMHARMHARTPIIPRRVGMDFNRGSLNSSGYPVQPASWDFKNLTDYYHSNGLKLGMYLTGGFEKVCVTYPLF